MKKILLLQEQISSYNVSTYNEIAKKYDLTLGYLSKCDTTQSCLFTKKKFSSKRLGPLLFVPGLRKFCANFDVVIIMPTLRIVSYCLLPFGRKKYKTSSWSIGFRVSYEHPYVVDRRHGIADWVFKLILSACDSNIFYMNKAREFWKLSNLRLDNVFEAINTTDVVKIDLAPEKKKDFLFVGTLYKGKGLDLLLQAFKNVISKSCSDTILHIVGSGPELETLKLFVTENRLHDKVIFHGPIYDELIISEVFKKALLCFSPTQAGLSVPKSMGYGVPFVTRKDAITGGEIYHITSNVNGLVYEEDADLINIMDDAISNRDKYIKMGFAAMDYYYNHATVSHMAQGAVDAIEYALNN